MLAERLITGSIIASLLITLFWVINTYETQLLVRQFQVEGGVKLKYSAAEVKNLIKTLPTYQGDSLTVFENGNIQSGLAELNGGLQHAQNDPATRQYLEGVARSEYLPLGFVVYRHVVPYYIEEQKKKAK